MSIIPSPPLISYDEIYLRVCQLDFVEVGFDCRACFSSVSTKPFQKMHSPSFGSSSNSKPKLAKLRIAQCCTSWEECIKPARQNSLKTVTDHKFQYLDIHNPSESPNFQPPNLLSTIFNLTTNLLSAYLIDKETVARP